ncbi:unnamed protein product, partial [Mesorhabditis spiculigera]
MASTSQLIRVLGGGSFGTVYLEFRNNRNVATKRINGIQDPRHLRREVKNLQSLALAVPVLSAIPRQKYSLMRQICTRREPGGRPTATDALDAANLIKTESFYKLFRSNQPTTAAGHASGSRPWRVVGAREDEEEPPGRNVAETSSPNEEDKLLKEIAAEEREEFQAREDRKPRIKRNLLDPNEDPSICTMIGCPQGKAELSFGNGTKRCVPFDRISGEIPDNFILGDCPSAGDCDCGVNEPVCVPQSSLVDYDNVTMRCIHEDCTELPGHHSCLDGEKKQSCIPYERLTKVINGTQCVLDPRHASCPLTALNCAKHEAPICVEMNTPKNRDGPLIGYDGSWKTCTLKECTELPGHHSCLDGEKKQSCIPYERLTKVINATQCVIDPRHAACPLTALNCARHEDPICVEINTTKNRDGPLIGYDGSWKTCTLTGCPSGNHPCLVCEKNRRFLCLPYHTIQKVTDDKRCPLVKLDTIKAFFVPSDDCHEMAKQKNEELIACYTSHVPGADYTCVPCDRPMNIEFECPIDGQVPCGSKCYPMEKVKMVNSNGTCELHKKTASPGIG